MKIPTDIMAVGIDPAKEVWSFPVVKAYVSANSIFSITNSIIIIDVDFLILYRAPEPFIKDIIHDPTSTIHTNLDIPFF